jgi:hypothetical protein
VNVFVILVAVPQAALLPGSAFDRGTCAGLSACTIDPDEPSAVSTLSRASPVMALRTGGDRELSDRCRVLRHRRLNVAEDDHDLAEHGLALGGTRPPWTDFVIFRVAAIGFLISRSQVARLPISTAVCLLRLLTVAVEPCAATDQLDRWREAA